MTDSCREMMDDLYGLNVDIVIVPLMLLEAVKAYRQSYSEHEWMFCYAIRRTKRGGLICIDKFCV